MQLKNFKIFTLCAILFANNGIDALSLPTEDMCVYHHTIRYSVKDDADFLKKSDDLLVCIYDYFDDSIQTINAANLDLDKLARSMEPGEGSRIFLKRYARLVKILLNYKPEHFNNAMATQRLKLLKIQKDLRLLINWFTKEHCTLNFSARAILKRFKLELENVDNSALLKETINNHMLSNPDYLKEFNEAQAYLQKDLVAFLKADKCNVTPKYIEKLMIDLVILQKSITI